MTSIAETSPSNPRAPRPAGATDRIVEALREAIVTLELKPGAILDKQQLTSRFGVSRFPVAEALNRLKIEGLVDIRPQSGSSVSLIRLADVRENIFLRRALEAETVAALAVDPDERLLDELRRNLRYQKAASEADDRQGFHLLDLAFHDIMVSASGYRRVRATVENARLALDRVRRLIGTPRRQIVTYDEHHAIVDALTRRDPAAARLAMAAHLDAVMVEIEMFAETDPTAFVGREA